MTGWIYNVTMHVTSPPDEDARLTEMTFVSDFNVPVPPEMTDPAEAVAYVWDVILDQVGEGDVVDHVVICRMIPNPVIGPFSTAGGN